jgi:hypothetical protein
LGSVITLEVETTKLLITTTSWGLTKDAFESLVIYFCITCLKNARMWVSTLVDIDPRLRTCTNIRTVCQGLRPFSAKHPVKGLRRCRTCKFTRAMVLSKSSIGIGRQVRRVGMLVVGGAGSCNGNCWLYYVQGSQLSPHSHTSPSIPRVA